MNNFGFAGRHFLQIGGTAIGTKVVPSFANTYMGGSNPPMYRPTIHNHYFGLDT